jgi:hypothetical protein
MSAPATRANARQGPEKATNKGHCTHKIAGKEFLVSLRGFLTVNSRCGGGLCRASLADVLGRIVRRELADAVDTAHA